MLVLEVPLILKLKCTLCKKISSTVTHLEYKGYGIIIQARRNCPQPMVLQMVAWNKDLFSVKITGTYEFFSKDFQFVTIVSEKAFSVKHPYLFSVATEYVFR